MEQQQKRKPITDDELNDMFGGPPPAKPNTTDRQRFFMTKAETCRENIKRLDQQIAAIAAQIAGHDTEAGAKSFVDRIAGLRRDRARNDKDMLRFLSYVGR